MSRSRTHDGTGSSKINGRRISKETKLQRTLLLNLIQVTDKLPFVGRLLRLVFGSLDERFQTQASKKLDPIYLGQPLMGFWERQEKKMIHPNASLD